MEKTWQWVTSVLDVAEGQLRQGQYFETQVCTYVHVVCMYVYMYICTCCLYVCMYMLSVCMYVRMYNVM